MNRRIPRAMALLAFGAACALPPASFPCESAETAIAPSGDVEVLQAYIDPGVAGFVIVTVLGFMSSIGYWARSHIGRMKRRLFGLGEADADDEVDGGDAPPDGGADGEGAGR